MKISSLFGISFIFTILILSTSLPYQTIEAQKGGPDFIPGQYIVVLEDGVSSQNVIKKHGAAPDFVYSHALNGFSAPLSPAALAELKQDPRVKYVEQVQKLSISVQDIPTGINRIDAEPGTSTTSYADKVTVAIIDTGIADHLDLNVVKKVNCAKKGPFNQECKEGNANDANGHGTHVAGTVAARDNTEGVVGVAPGANLWAMKVFKDNGDGWTSYSIAALDYIIGQGGVDVVNMSLTSSTSQAVNDAVKRTYDAGIVVVVAAGNQLSDASTRSPASAPEAITVSAIADFNGRGGGGADQTVNFSICTEDTDDSFACFSNFGSLIDIAAPGVLILSTWNDGGYATISGTSMASPHVAGAAAKLIADARNLNPPQELSTSDVLGGLLANSITQGDDYFSGDPDSYAEPLLYVGNTSGNPSVSITNPNNGDTVSGTVIITADASDDNGVNKVEFFVDGTLLSSDTISPYSYSWDTPSSDGTYSISVTVTDTDTNTASDSISVIVNNVDDPPTVSITNPKHLDTVSGTVIITADALDDNGVNKVEFFVDDISVGVDSDGNDGWSMSWDTTKVSDADYTLKATATDSANLPSSDSISVTVSNTSPTTATTVSVSSITYDGEGGKNKDKHLLITIALIDDLQNPVSGASVTIELYRDGGFVDSATGTTGSTGNVSFSLKNAASGCYTTDITSISSNLNWDGISPGNNFGLRVIC